MSTTMSTTTTTPIFHVLLTQFLPKFEDRFLGSTTTTISTTATSWLNGNFTYHQGMPCGYSKFVPEVVWQYSKGSRSSWPFVSEKTSEKWSKMTIFGISNTIWMFFQDWVMGWTWFLLHLIGQLLAQAQSTHIPYFGETFKSPFLVSMIHDSHQAKNRASKEAVSDSRYKSVPIISRKTNTQDYNTQIKPASHRLENHSCNSSTESSVSTPWYSGREARTFREERGGNYNREKESGINGNKNKAAGHSVQIRDILSIQR